MSEYKEPSAPPIYPTLPKDEISTYRLTKISELQGILEKEQNERKALYKKYKRSINILDWIDASCAIISTGLSAGGMTLLAGIITSPIAIGLEVGAGMFALASVGGNYIRRKLHKKAKKHNDIKTTAVSKLNTITDHISKALKDSTISDEEFNLILSEFEKYQQLKKEIRNQLNTLNLDEQAKKDLIQQGRELERSSIFQTLDSKSN